MFRLGGFDQITGSKMIPQQQPLLDQVAETLRQARMLPVGEARNNLRQIAMLLKGLHHMKVDPETEIADTEPIV